MEVSEFLKAIGNVNSIWSIAAFTMAAVLALMNLYLRNPSKADSGDDKKVPAGSLTTRNIVWAGVGIICIMGLAPIAANAYLETQHAKVLSVYHIRAIVVDEKNIPITGAHLRTAASSETSTTSDGDGAITIARGSLPADGKITIFADKESAYLHGSAAIQLGNDPNPTVFIHAQRDSSAAVTGMVEDGSGHAIQGAVVSLAGGSSTQTSETGNFTLVAHAAPGQPVTLHIEKKGYQPVDQMHLAGSDAAVVVLQVDDRARRQ